MAVKMHYVGLLNYLLMPIKFFYCANVFRMSQFATADEFTDTTLRVLTIEKRQYGNYTCKAVNKLGQYSTQIVLYG